MHPKVNDVLQSMLEGVFPGRCCMCELACPGPLPLCEPCRAELPANHSCCQRCALPLPPVPGVADRLCGNCLRQAPPFQRVIAPWIYDEQLALLIQRWKYQGEQRLSPLLAQLWLSGAAATPRVDLLVPVPLHWRKLWRRGFNQATLLASALQSANTTLSGTPLTTRGIRRHRATEAQSGMSAALRERNLRAAFTVERCCDNLRIAIVDDVMTTGATTRALSYALMAAGAAHVEVWCLARTPAPANGGHAGGSAQGT